METATLVLVTLNLLVTANMFGIINNNKETN